MTRLSTRWLILLRASFILTSRRTYNFFFRYQYQTALLAQLTVFYFAGYHLRHVFVLAGNFNFVAPGAGITTRPNGERYTFASFPVYSSLSRRNLITYRR